MPESEFKRPADGPLAVVPSKRPRSDLVVKGSQPRTSSLSSPIVKLTGHDGEIYTGKFSPDGTFLVTAGFERLIFFWNTYGECENFSVLKGHGGAIMEVQLSSDSRVVVSCATDKTIRLWDMETGSVIRKLKSHQSFVNSIHNSRRGPHLICSGSDDGTVRIWDARQREPLHTLQSKYQVTAVTFNDTAEQVVSGGIDNDLKVWDLRKVECVYRMRGHTDTVTGLSLSPDGTSVLSNAMDNSLRIWDVRPFAPENRCMKSFQGHQHNFEKNLLRCCWSPDGKRISAGSGDKFVYVWDVNSRRILYKLPGHNGSVNETCFHPLENIGILSVEINRNWVLE